MPKNALLHTTTETPYISHLIKQQINALADKKKGIPTLKKAVKIITAVLKDNHEGDTPHGIINYVLRVHLFSLAHKGRLNVTIFEDRQTSTQEICSILYNSAPKFSATRNKLGRIKDLMKPQKVQALINGIVTNIRDTPSEPPITMRRTPVNRKQRSDQLRLRA